MPRIPAVCENCQAIFPSRVDVRAQNVTFVSCGGGACPRCGGNSKILDGVYSALGNTLHILLQQANTGLLKQLVPVLDEAAKRQLSRDTIRARIEETTPELRTIGDCLPETRTELYAFIAILLTLLAMLIAVVGHKSGDKTEPSQQVINQYIDNSLEITYRAADSK